MKTSKQKNKSWLVFLNKIKDYIFPVYCLGCKKEGEWLCEKCFAKLDLSGVFCCPVCHKDTERGEYCLDCKKDLPLDFHIAISPYKEDSLLGDVIHTLKYSWAEDVAEVFDKMIDGFVKNNKDLFKNIDYVVPIPLHKKRFAERGFNQAELVAKLISEKLDKPLKNILERSKQTKQQAKLKRDERIKNLENAFSAKEKIEGNVLLIDDVFTTGSTMQEGAKALKEVGVGGIVGFSMARG